MEKLETFKKILLNYAFTDYCNCRMLKPKKYYKISQNITDMSDVIIDLTWKIFDDEKNKSQITKDNTYECLIQYNKQNGMFEVIKNLRDNFVDNFPKTAESFFKEITSRNVPYFVIGIWHKDTDFSEEFPW